MEEYYKILGLEPGATSQEIKRAYFSLVRKYSPESEPEKFREIREAYEQLQNPVRQDGPVFPELSDPWAVKILQQIRKYQQQGQKQLTRDACEEAWRIFPEERQFLYLLAVAQRQAGNTGKAIKSCERLVKEEPENRWFRRELAVSYIERGFTKKAYYACKDAYEMGCRDNDFVLMYSVICHESGDLQTGISILLELVERKKRWHREEVPEIIEAYCGLLAMDALTGIRHFSDIMSRLKEFIGSCSVYIEENVEMLCSCLMYFMTQDGFGSEEYRLSGDVLSALENVCRSEEKRGVVNELKLHFLYGRLKRDPRIGEEISRYMETAFFMDEDPSLQKYSVTDTKLCMLEKRQEMIGQLEILRQDYPECYEKIREFARQLCEGKDLPRLKASLLKQYISMSNYHGGGYYFEEYPQEKAHVRGRVVYDGSWDEPYVRETKKIGRNDPCPCGSGKKYKQCCGR